MKNLIFVSLLAISTSAFSQNGEVYSIRPFAPDDYFHNFPLRIENGVKEVPGMDTENSFLTSPDDVQTRIFPPVQLHDTIFYWKLDTSINEWVFKRRSIDYLYDNHNNLLSVTIQKWDGMQWVDSSQIIRTYETDLLKYVVVKEKIDTIWQNDYSNIYTYDQGLQTSLLVQYWDSSSWVNSWRETRSYDVNSKLEVKGKEVWNDSTLTWDQDWEYLYSYDKRGNQISEVYRSWVLFASQWAYGKRQLYTYNDSNKVTSHTTQQSHGFPEWGNEDLVLNTYDSMQNVIAVVKQKWDSGAWINVSQQLSTYDSLNNLVNLNVQSWNGAWVDTDRVILAYDDDNNPTYVLSQKWNNGTWSDFRRQVLVYGDDHTLISHLIWRWISNEWAINLQIKNTYDEDLYQTSTAIRRYSGDGIILLSGDSTNYFFIMVSAKDQFTNDGDQPVIYPNPCNGRFFVQCTNMEAMDVYTMTGRKVYDVILNNDQTSIEIDLTGQSAGIYIVVLHDGNSIYAHKIVIQ